MRRCHPTPHVFAQSRVWGNGETFPREQVDEEDEEPLFRRGVALAQEGSTTKIFYFWYCYGVAHDFSINWRLFIKKLTFRLSYKWEDERELSNLAIFLSLFLWAEYEKDYLSIYRKTFASNEWSNWLPLSVVHPPPFSLLILCLWRTYSKEA